MKNLNLVRDNNPSDEVLDLIHLPRNFNKHEDKFSDNKYAIENARSRLHAYWLVVVTRFTD